jgi:predicted HicB family RNase H-like nuclease
MNSDGWVKFLLRVPTGMMEYLKIEANRQGLSVSELIRVLIMRSITNG